MLRVSKKWSSRKSSAGECFIVQVRIRRRKDSSARCVTKRDTAGNLSFCKLDLRAARANILTVNLRRMLYWPSRIGFVTYIGTWWPVSNVACITAPLFGRRGSKQFLKLRRRYRAAAINRWTFADDRRITSRLVPCLPRDHGLAICIGARAQYYCNAYRVAWSSVTQLRAGGDSWHWLYWWGGLVKSKRP